MHSTAYVTDGRGGLVLLSRPLPMLKADEVLLEISASALNFRDVPFIRGDERRGPSYDRIPLSDAVGRVQAVGVGVTRVEVGDRVSPTVLPQWIDGSLSAKCFVGSFASQTRDGFLATATVIEAEALVHIPDYLSDLEAAGIPCAALTAWHALAEIQAIRPGGVVAIESTGGVAIFALQIAKAMGLLPIVISRSDEKLALARQHGAWETINSLRHPAWDTEVQRMTESRGADLVLDMGIAEGLPRSCRAAAFEGTVAIIGVVNGWKTQLDIGPVMNKI